MTTIRSTNRSFCRSFCWTLLVCLVLLFSQGSSAAEGQDANSGETVVSSGGELVHAEENGHNTGSNDEEGGGAATAHAEEEPADAVLFPFFILALGVISYRLLSRYAAWFPYTGFMFVLGAIIGAGATRVEGQTNLLHISVVDYWLPIDSELLLVSFLPGLLYHDASGQNSYLFRAALFQCIILAFPMVLAGTALTAMVAFYIFPYGWSFQLAMTFGSILSATDPVAVAALLEQVGAPPRLKVHIAGESLLNDGSAIVFFSIFSSMYLLELGVDGLGEAVDLPNGIKLFFHKSLGGACIGVVFALGLLAVLYLLNHRLDREENVTQVGATFTVAYLCYFVADVAWGGSGVIAVVTLGVMTTTFGDTFINDPKLMHDFWSIVEWLLNTTLFALGGLVWGSIISNADDEYPEREFNKKDWSYLILLYILLTVIRFGLLLTFYPIISRMGLGSNLKELIFEGHSGLRGALGIALAIFLDNTVKANSAPESEYVHQTNKLFGFVGGIALLTLMINGITAGPLLHYLGLSDTSSTRKRMMNCFLEHNRRNGINGFIELMRQRRFRKVNFSVVRTHVPFLRDVSRAEIIEAANHAFTEIDALDNEFHESAVHLEGVLTFLSKISDVDTDERTLQRQASSTFSQFDRESVVSDDVLNENNPMGGSDAFFGASGIPAAMRTGNTGEMTANEFRRLFLELLRSCYRKQIDSGELVDRGFVVLSLIESLELAAESVERENRLNDWDYVFLVKHPSVSVGGHTKDGENKVTLSSRALGYVQKCFPVFSTLPDGEIVRKRVVIEKCLAFILAHTTAQSIITEYFFSDAAEGQHLSEVIEQRILAESESEVALAEAKLHAMDKTDVENAVSLKVCKILLNNSSKYFESLVENGLCKDQDVAEIYEEIQTSLLQIDTRTIKQRGRKKEKKDVMGEEQESEIEFEENKPSQEMNPPSVRVDLEKGQPRHKASQKVTIRPSEPTKDSMKDKVEETIEPEKVSIPGLFEETVPKTEPAEDSTKGLLLEETIPETEPASDGIKGLFEEETLTSEVFDGALEQGEQEVTSTQDNQ